MGVTYKLKKEVVDYILLQKRTSPRLSCRKISNLASQFFQREISKSSVNTILKTFLLSSPVGRRAKTDKKQESFKIPEHRKKELFANVPRDALGQSEQSPEVLETLKPRKEMLSVSLDLILLKIAEFQIKEKGIMSTFFEEKTHMLESLVYAPVFGLATLSDMAQDKAFLRLNGLDPSLNFEEAQKAIEEIEALAIKIKEVKFKGFDLFSEAKHFKASLKNGEEFIIDCQLNSVWTKENVQSKFSLPIEKSLDFLSRNLITNIEPLVLRCAPGTENFPSCFYAMLGCFEGFNSRAIDQIDLVSQENEVLSSFDLLLLKKRYFISGLLNTHALFSEALSKKGPTLDVYVESCDQNVLYSEADIVLAHPFLEKSLSLRVLILKVEGCSPFGLMTNILRSKKDAVQVINLYLKKWPYGVVGCQDFAMIKEEANSKKVDPFFSIDEKIDLEAKFLFFEKENVFIHNILIKLYKYCQMHFLPTRLQDVSYIKIKEIFSDIKVKIDFESSYPKAVVMISRDHMHVKDVEYVVRRVNECEPCFYDKKIIFLKVS